jgi:hypothetical protein
LGGSCSTYGERRLAYRVLVGKSANNRLFGRPRLRSKDNIKRRLSDMGGMDWIDLAQNRDRLRAFVNVVMNLGVP